MSAALTDLKGNLDDVSGYEDPSEFSPGPYVRINEGVNAYGTLQNFAERELKLAFWGALPWDLRGGAFLTARSGDHYSPRFRISGQGSFYGYLANAESWVKPCNPIHGECKPPGGDPLPMSFVQPLGA